MTARVEFDTQIEKFFSSISLNSLPPALSNQKMNDNLKTIGKLVGLNEPIIVTTTRGSERIATKYKKYELISTHTMRRSFQAICTCRESLL
jgi:hypothetical protein